MCVVVRLRSNCPFLKTPSIGGMGLSLAGGVGVALGLVDPVGCSSWGRLLLFFYVTMFRPRGPTSPQCGGVFLVLNAVGIGLVGRMSKKIL